MIIGIRAVATAFLTNPIGLAITAIIVVLMLLYYNWDTVKDYLIAGWNMLKNAINSVVNWFNGTLVPAWNDGINAIGNFFSNLWEGIKAGVSGAVSFIKEGINTIISALNGISFHIPDWVPNWGGKDFSLNIPLLFTGTENWKGGLAKIHDQGGEIIDLPSGTRVMPHDKSVKEAREMGRKEGAVNNRTNNSININKLADSIVVREEADIDKIISGLVEKLQVHAINTMEGLYNMSLFTASTIETIVNKGLSQLFNKNMLANTAEDGQIILTGKTGSITLPVPPPSYSVKVANNNSIVNIQSLGDINMIGKTGLQKISFLHSYQV